MEALERSPLLDAAGWGHRVAVNSDWVGRGIVSGKQDAQILAALQTGWIAMPLWGASLDRTVAESFGSRFVFELEGYFPAVPAWVYSGIKPEEQELVCGGRYVVASLEEISAEQTLVRLHFDSTIARLP